MADDIGSKNKIIRTISDEEHVLYEVSAEIITVLQYEPLFDMTFRNVDSYMERIVQSLSHTRSEAERTRTALDLMNDLWRTRADFGPYLVPNLLATFEYERLFYPLYRDHTVHQLRVLLLGLYLYCCNSILREALRQEVRKLTPSIPDHIEELDRSFIKAWLVTAIYHDQGYVFELARQPDDDRHLNKVFTQFNRFFEAPLSEYLKEYFGLQLPKAKEVRSRVGLRLPQAFRANSFDDLLFEPDGESSVLDQVESLIDLSKLGPQGQSARQYFEMARSEKPLVEGRNSFYDHGIASAVMLLRSHQELRRYVEDMVQADEIGALERFIPNDEIRQAIVILRDDLINSRELIRHAAAAIAVHNIDPTIWSPDLYAGPRYRLDLESFQVSLTDSPLAFLLILCDTLQDWDRPRFTLPRDTQDYSRLDQHLLISANDREVAVRFYLAEAWS
jgi:hypothetical protein